MSGVSPVLKVTPPDKVVIVATVGNQTVNLVASVAPSATINAVIGTGGRNPSEGFTLNNGANISTGTTVGSQIGTDPVQKLAFWGATPIIQPPTLTDVGGGVNAGFDGVDRLELETTINNFASAINLIHQRLKDLGLISS